MTMVRTFAMVFAAIFAAITLMAIAFPLAFAFLFWDIKFLLKDEFALIFWLVIRSGVLIAAFMAIIISLSPDVREAVYKDKLAKDALKAKMKAK